MKQKVLLGLSGGVDSSVAALLLQKQGYEVIGAFMRCFSEKKNKITGECPWIEDRKSAQKIASMLGIKFITLNYEKEYTNQVIKPMFRDYARGLTPNPDSACNTIVKFPYLWFEARKLGCQFIATGHYIKKIKKGNKFYLKIPKDNKKDQSYFLYGLSQEDLKHTLFPIGEYTKSEVRDIAKKSNLQNWNRQGTRGLCFVGNIDVKDFLKQKIKNKQGIIKDPEGNIVGKHNGMMFYTIGERLGENQDIQINNEYRNKVKSKIYIASKDLKKNILIVAPENHTALKKNEFKIKDINYISAKPKSSKILVRIRHLGELHKAEIKGNKVILNKPIEGVAEGQSAVIYTKSKIMLGGGEITY
ncbi:MAG: tRNA 2-thiouridine(34) synthase MnmA [Candidatus Pacearchaeota archaeon]